MTKKDVTERLNSLTEWDTKTFNSHKKMPRGAVNFVDHVCVHRKTGHIVFIEVKTHNDVLREGQSQYRQICIDAMKNNNKFSYFLCEENSLDLIIKVMKDIKQ